ncbi:stalk domain-containing protein [Cohnella lupini]|uniref:Outer membrane protein assembly factor BamB n=1 Tax=Cohnella lupini TaxID=1294267 RepID=A0A3D9HP43_9BACL|nr:stalk domain-containing protein [Cohnella lupini]RED51185.1 outer membrane protein assembly factor BamB [Cohnella lupini]
MKKLCALCLTFFMVIFIIPNQSYGATDDVYLPDSTGVQLKWEYKETPPKRPYPKLLNAVNYESKWKMDNSLLFNLALDQNGILYTTDSDDTLHAVYPNGKQKWSIRLNMGFDHSVIYFKLGQDGTIYAYSSDILAQPRLTSICALSPDGEVKWKLPPSAIYSQFNNNFAGDSEGNFVYFSNEGLVSRNAKGEINWINKNITTTDPAKYLESLFQLFQSTLYIDSKGNIYVDTANGEIISLDSTGTERWRSQPQSYLDRFTRFYPFFSESGFLYMLTIDGLHALNANDGSTVEFSSPPDFSDIRSSGMPMDGKDGFYIQNQGQIQKIDYKGNLKWAYFPRATEKYSIGQMDSLVTDDKGNVYFHTGVGNIISLNGEGKEIFVFLRNAFWHIITDMVVGKNGNIYSSNMDIGLIAFGKKQIQVYLDNLALPLPVAPIMDGSTVLVPFRSLFESLGLGVGWDPVSKTITGTKEGLTIQMNIGSKNALVNGQVKQLPLAPKITSNSAYVPLRFVGEALDKNLSWDSKSSSVNIDSK